MNSTLHDRSTIVSRITPWIVLSLSTLLVSLTALGATVPAATGVDAAALSQRFLPAAPATRITQFRTLQDIRARRSELVFDSPSQIRVDLLPYLEAPSSVPRIAENLRALAIDPNLQVSVQILDFPDRVIVKQELLYMGNARMCAERGPDLSARGIQCFEKTAESILPPGVEEEDLNDLVREIRAALDGLQQSPIAGYSISELKAMTDDDLLGAALNGGEQSSESYLMVPKIAWSGLSEVPRSSLVREVPRQPPNLLGTSSILKPGAEVSTSLTESPSRPAPRIAPGIHSPEVRPTPAPGGIAGGETPVWGTTPVTRHQTETRYLVNGFTWAQSYPWAHRFGACVKIPLVSKKCAHLEPYAELGYGLGLRIPLQVDFTMELENVPVEQKLLGFRTTVNVFPIDGSASVYQAAGMPQDKLFNGKEIVAEASAQVGLRYNIVGSKGNPNHTSKLDFTDHLSSKGHFTPPRPGQAFTFGEVWSPDLSGSCCNLGFAGVTFHAGVKADMNGRGLTVSYRYSPMLSDGTASAFPARINPRVMQNKASYNLFDAIYTANWSATPGLRARAFLNVKIYKTSKNFDFWISQIAINTPDYRFGPHQGTVQGYRVAADSREATIQPRSQ